MVTRIPLFLGCFRIILLTCTDFIPMRQIVCWTRWWKENEYVIFFFRKLLLWSLLAQGSKKYFGDEYYTFTLVGITKSCIFLWLIDCPLMVFSFLSRYFLVVITFDNWTLSQRGKSRVFYHMHSFPYWRLIWNVTLALCGVWSGRKLFICALSP